MNAACYTIFCEGESDQKFLSDLLEHLGISDSEVRAISGGVETLPTIAPQIRQALATSSVALILDSDSNFHHRKEEIAEVMRKEEITVDHVFLFPNNSDPGNLETLLEQLNSEEHQAIHDCFEDYKTCLANNSSDYLMPSQKGKIYAYCEAMGCEARAPHRDYLNEECWNLDADVLEPLTEFFGALTKQ